MTQLHLSSRPRETAIELARSIGRRELADTVHQMFDACIEHHPEFRFELAETTEMALRTVDLAVAEGWNNWSIATVLSWLPKNDGADLRARWQASILISIGSWTTWAPAADIVVALHAVRETLARRSLALN